MRAVEAGESSVQSGVQRILRRLAARSGIVGPVDESTAGKLADFLSPVGASSAAQNVRPMENVNPDGFSARYPIGKPNWSTGVMGWRLNA